MTDYQTKYFALDNGHSVAIALCAIPDGEILLYGPGPEPIRQWPYIARDKWIRDKKDRESTVPMRGVVWMDARGDKIALVEVDGPNDYLSVFEIGKEEPIQKLLLTYYLPSEIVKRAWLTPFGVLVSPVPDYEVTLSLMLVPFAKKDLGDGPFATLTGWVTDVMVSDQGNFFAVFDYEDDTVSLHSLPDMKRRWSASYGRCPLSVKEKEGTVEVEFRGAVTVISKQDWETL